ncbi:MAG: M55 family metallopeptidase, partial [Candidatus Marinimicrobia bacterium]|nr:M55 family metallopeptidase [Candidatus Neomarinimicrobiota bacterium]
MNVKRIYISCDMEGIAGICSDRHREIGDVFYEWGR